jgi:hypothetical protein
MKVFIVEDEPQTLQEPVELLVSVQEKRKLAL